MSQPTSKHSRAILDATAPIFRFATGPLYTENAAKPEMSNFALGNPHDMPIAGFAETLQKWSVPQNKDWFAYKSERTRTQETVANSLRAWRGVEFHPRDIYLTNGAFAGLVVALGAILDPGDEVIYNSPPWFFYEPIIVHHYAEPVRVKINPHTFDLDLDAIEAAMTPRTRAIIVNSPNNPTGKIYPPETLRALAALWKDIARKMTAKSISFRMKRIPASFTMRAPFTAQPRIIPTRFWSIRTAKRC